MDRVLDWRSNHDPRSRNYGVAAVTPTVEPKAKMWKPGPVLDQGTEGACVGFGWSGECAASPVRVPNIDDAYALGVYRDARAQDKLMGVEWDSGASVIGGARALKDRGLLDSYLWAFTVDDVRTALIQHGPVVIGISWYDGMYETRPSGLVDVSGPIVGGHCIVLTGYHPNMRIKGEGWRERFEVVRWRNSWGPNYGVGGDGYLRLADLEKLLADQGEACVPVGRHLPK